MASVAGGGVVLRPEEAKTIDLGGFGVTVLADDDVTGGGFSLAVRQRPNDLHLVALGDRLEPGPVEAFGDSRGLRIEVASHPRRRVQVELAAPGLGRLKCVAQ